MAKQIGVHQFHLEDYLIATEKYSHTEIDNVFALLCDADKQVKSVSFNKKLIMQELVAEILINKK